MQPVDFVPMAGTCQYAGTRRTGVFSLQAMISTQFTEQQMWPINVVPTTGTSENSQYAGTRRADTYCSQAVPTQFTEQHPQPAGFVSMTSTDENAQYKVMFDTLKAEYFASWQQKSILADCFS